MTCGVCREAGHSRRDHYKHCGACGKTLFFHRLSLGKDNIERSEVTLGRREYLCGSCYQEASSLHSA